MGLTGLKKNSAFTGIGVYKTIDKPVIHTAVVDVDMNFCHYFRQGVTQDIKVLQINQVKNLENKWLHFS